MIAKTSRFPDRLQTDSPGPGVCLRRLCLADLAADSGGEG